MYIMLNKRYGLLAGVLLIAPIHAWSDDESPLLLKSRELTAEYAWKLKSALQESMAEGGPVESITVCSDVAPQLASQISRTSGAKVGRTSWRFRNPANAPNDWEAQALNHLEATGNPEYFELLPNGGARYLKAIPTGPVCLSCHGETLAPAIADRLSETYPHDRATGFAVGDMRGAFSVAWPAGSLESD